MNLEKEVLDVLHQRLLKLRNIETLVASREFKQVYEEADNKQIVRSLIDNYDVEGIRRWYREERTNQVGLLGLRELREVASRLGVVGYNKLPKSLLLSEIKRIRNAFASNRKSVERNGNLDSGSGGSNGHPAEAPRIAIQEITDMCT